MDSGEPGKWLIEEAFPLEEVSAASKREKNIRHGHISTLHIWWARRPLAASRATAFAALIPDPKDEEERKKLLDLVAQLAPWEVVSQESESNRELLETARKLIREAQGGQPPKVLDCFAGGGAIPLEALRLGCETYALDYNPVAVLILKAILEYPQKFGNWGLGIRNWGEQDENLQGARGLAEGSGPDCHGVPTWQGTPSSHTEPSPEVDSLSLTPFPSSQSPIPIPHFPIPNSQSPPFRGERLGKLGS